jgi:competence ComEA-like helix-hairpin-helix protein
MFSFGNKKLALKVSLSLLITFVIALSYISYSLFNAHALSQNILNPVSLGQSQNYITVYLGEGFENKGFYQLQQGITYGELLATHSNDIDIKSLSITPDKQVKNGEKIVFKANSIVYQGNSDVASKDINTASVTDLKQAKGVGDKTAKTLIDYININGPISSIDELKNVKGVGDKTITELKKYFY